MADMAVAGGLMPHQKDEHDIWICRSCGWKYPNAKPSAKIRKNHKKHCPGTAGTAEHGDEGSSDDKSDDDHHLPIRGKVAPKEIPVDAPIPQMETKSRDFDLASLKENLKLEGAPATAPVVNGASKEASAQKEATTPSTAPVSPGGLMPHQKDEHDVWICKACGWKYPNAKPSPKIRTNHNKHCPGSGGPVAGGFSDEASDEEPHFAPDDPAVAAELGRNEEHDSSARAPTEAPMSISKEIDLAALKEPSSPEVTEATPTTDTSGHAGNGTTEFSSPATFDNTRPQQSPADTPTAAEYEEEDPPSAGRVLRIISGDTDFAALKEPSDPVVKRKTPVAGPGKTSAVIPGKKRTNLQTTAKPPWRY